jgi:DNA-binding CsgD family transcriptional regulator
LVSLADTEPTEQAVPRWREAMETALWSGANGLHADVLARLTAAGVEVSGEQTRAAYLTSTERRIATLSADGADERQIAQALFITPLSVQETLAGVRQRLGVSSAAQLRAALAALPG